MASNTPNNSHPKPLMKTQVGRAGANPTLGTEKSIWDGPTITKLGWSPYIVITPSNKQQKLECKGIFRTVDALRACGVLGKILDITHQKTGDLLVELENASDSLKLLKTKEFNGTPVTVQKHRSLNTCKGVVKSRHLQDTPDEDFQRITGVTDAKNLPRRVKGKLVPSWSWVLTFASPTLPTRIVAEYLTLEVRPYIPSPMRCFRCQKFGHTKNRCNRHNPVCKNCGTETCTTEECKKTTWCPNCKEEGHQASSKDCPIWIEEKNILEQRARYGGTYQKARDTLYPNREKRKSYAKVTAENIQRPTDQRETNKKSEDSPTKRKNPRLQNRGRNDIPTSNRYAILDEENAPHMTKPNSSSQSSSSSSSSPSPHHPSSTPHHSSQTPLPSSLPHPTSQHPFSSPQPSNSPSTSQAHHSLTTSSQQSSPSSNHTNVPQPPTSDKQSENQNTKTNGSKDPEEEESMDTMDTSKTKSQIPKPKIPPKPPKPPPQLKDKKKPGPLCSKNKP